MRRANNAFTLIELLVVVTILVILIAMLLPAMDKAIYQAELTTCGAQIRGMAGGMLTYAAGSKRQYPRPPAGRSAGHSSENLGQRSVPNSFLMPVLDPYFTRDSYQCPMLGGMSYEERDNHPETGLYGNYYLWIAARYTDVAGNKGMFKIGDRLEHRMAAGDTPRRFNTLVTDMNTIELATENAITAHPDHKGIIPKYIWQDADQTTARSTFSRWTGGGNGRPIRSAVDLNFAFDDASVQRLTDLELHDDRVETIPHHMTRGNNWWAMIPPAN